MSHLGHENLRLGEGRVADDAGGPVPLRATRRPGLERADVSRLYAGRTM